MTHEVPLVLRREAWPAIPFYTETHDSKDIIETAAAILTKLAFEQNDELKSRIQAFKVNTPQGAEAIILPVYREILAALEGGASVRGGQNASRAL